MFDPFKRPQFGPGLHVTLKKPRCIKDMFKNSWRMLARLRQTSE
jgi:hypothetical protein